MDDEVVICNVCGLEVDLHYPAEYRDGGWRHVSLDQCVKALLVENEDLREQISELERKAGIS